MSNPSPRSSRLRAAVSLAALTLGALSLAAVERPALADSSLRCGQRLVSVGDSTYKVRAACGVPNEVSQRREWRTGARLADLPCGPGTTAVCRQLVRDTVEIRVEEWTYDFGSNRFLRFVRFEQGKLVSVTSGGYGGLARAR